jgi:AraC-like DNA-binding protein
VYAESPPPPALADLVECVWRHELPAARPGGSDRILPDGRVDLVWTGQGRTLVAGPQTAFVDRPLTPPFAAVGVRFRPGAGPALLGLPAHELVDLHVPLDAIDARPARALTRRLAALADPDGAAGALTGGVAALRRESRGPDALVLAAARLLDRPRATVAELPAQLALSERQLQRRFREAVGYGPKTLQRILRLQRFLGPTQAADGLALRALAAGYADQAHLTREARALAGLTPAELTRRWAR